MFHLWLDPWTPTVVSHAGDLRSQEAPRRHTPRSGICFFLGVPFLAFSARRLHWPAILEDWKGFLACVAQGLVRPTLASKAVVLLVACFILAWLALVRPGLFEDLAQTHAVSGRAACMGHWLEQ